MPSRSNSFIYWAEISPNSNQLRLQVAPLHVGPLMEQFLWHEKTSVILTSATLTANEGFDYLRNRLNADEADEIQLGSPFDYETAAHALPGERYPRANRRQWLPARGRSDADPPGQGHRRAYAGSVHLLCPAAPHLDVHLPALAEAGITVYEQGEGASPNTLLETFREADKAVLLGTRSFWEGVDIPGEALSVLVIVKLPFDVPIRSDHRRPFRDLRGSLQRIPACRKPSCASARALAA